VFGPPSLPPFLPPFCVVALCAYPALKSVVADTIVPKLVECEVSVWPSLPPSFPPSLLCRGSLCLLRPQVGGRRHHRTQARGARGECLALPPSLPPSLPFVSWLSVPTPPSSLSSPTPSYLSSSNERYASALYSLPRPPSLPPSLPPFLPPSLPSDLDLAAPGLGRPHPPAQVHRHPRTHRQDERRPPCPPSLPPSRPPEEEFRCPGDVGGVRVEGTEDGGPGQCQAEGVGVVRWREGGREGGRGRMENGRDGLGNTRNPKTKEK